ncbi:unnamed protein product [Rotaria sordida]|uniref:Phosphatidic acid phosphatase type 2/haloperoxidase domain-containing protein n=1 Tax=Rotaria sordida TaxID=392033 RepID=A0A814R7Q2_9BILA|nr:unnamed protein product [Rotaria sordida]CAF1356189.1 unnamed protein product [Rotaria sordida]
MLQLDNRAFSTISLNTGNDQNQEEEHESGMFAVHLPPRINQGAVATDQYHHNETIWRVILDVISLIILLVITIISHYVAKPFTRGFFCSDASIQYPHKDNTIPTYAAVILSIGLPILWMWITEFCKRAYFNWYAEQAFITRLELCGNRVAYISPFVRNLYMLTVIFFFGYLSTWVLTEIAKNFVGELRPHFRAVCQPTYNCSAVTSLNQFNTYLQYGIDFTCQNTDDTAVREARRSFFSGHASAIFYGLVWLIMYIHVSWSWRHLGILGHLFQIGIAILAFYIGYSRISDYQHHWQDVLAGGILGSFIAFFTFKFILNWRHYSPKFLPYTVSSLPRTPPIYQRRNIDYGQMKII